MIKKIFRWSVLFVSLVFANAQAAPILQVDGGGKLTGATGVDVLGTLYDVEFLDGTCIALFSGCDATADFTFSSRVTAAAAAQALLDQVFLNGPLDLSPAGLFDSIPSLTSGCSISFGCLAIFPYNLSLDGVDVAAAANHPSIAGVDTITGEHVTPDFDTSTLPAHPTYTWARWSPAAQSVPEPGTIAILGAGLLGLVLTRRRRALLGGMRDRCVILGEGQ